MNCKEFAEKYLGREYKTEGYVGIVCGYDEDDLEGEGVVIGSAEEYLSWGKAHIHPNDIILEGEYKGYRYVYPVEDNIIGKTPSNKEKVIISDNTEELIEEYTTRFKDVDRIIVNDNATIVILKDKRKGIVKLQKDDNPDVRVGILEAYIKAMKNKLTYGVTLTSTGFHPKFGYVPHLQI